MDRRSIEFALRALKIGNTESIRRVASYLQDQSIKAYPHWEYPFYQSHTTAYTAAKTQTYDVVASRERGYDRDDLSGTVKSVDDMLVVYTINRATNTVRSLTVDKDSVVTRFFGNHERHLEYCDVSLEHLGDDRIRVAWMNDKGETMRAKELTLTETIGRILEKDGTGHRSVNPSVSY